MRVFLYTYQSFTTPEMLLKKLIQRYHVPIPKGMEEDKFKTELQQPIRLRVCNGNLFSIVIHLTVLSSPEVLD
jgi:glycine hydroxymethyltransferase/Rap guanine nucleotide exchange factor 1